MSRRERQSSYGDAQKQREMNEAAERAKVQRREDIQSLLEKPEGRRVFQWLFAETRPFSDSFNGNSRDLYEKGVRKIGLLLLEEVRRAKPEITLEELFGKG